MHLYLHIPFCKQACYYCDFHFSTNLKYKNDLVEALIKEIVLQKNYLNDKRLQTIYFGGGTPSLLDRSDLENILDEINKHYSLDQEAEITLEANPDDITEGKLKDWRELGINRLSLGIQTFNDEQLVYLNRAHTSKHAIDCIKMSLAEGFNDFSIDLIYGIPSKSHDIWKKNLDTALQFDFTHLSAYCLTIEEKTVFGAQLKKNQIKQVSEEFAAEQFNYLLDQTRSQGVEQYEISNFSRDQHYAKHNTSYWQGEEYLGIGPSAHSFNGVSRQWNVANNAKYIRSINQGIVDFELEELTKVDIANELIMTGLRTKWGLDLAKIEDLINSDFEKTTHFFEQEGDLLKDGNRLVLTDKGKLIADGIASDLFFT
ncbi:radical SAM family heme chaperone HemW [Jiulongibacter sp. NS-SX5]|uniref:radical SAM family heme chaperone HemW n=1 Tax=Jiulongibacter sp. NS-SX5 TaxID=3463854 RepID=UPI004059784C